MSTDDHDPMRERREAMSAWERGLRPKQDRRWALWLVLAALLVFLLYRGAEWLLAQRISQPARAPGPTLSPSPSSIGRTAPVSPPASHGLATPDTVEVTKCLAPSGKTAYSDGPCPEGSHATTVRLRRDVNLADGMSVAEREASNRNNAVIAGQQQEYERQVARNADHAMAECNQLDEYVKTLDAAARQPRDMYSQDRLRSERHAARDRRFRLGCP